MKLKPSTIVAIAAVCCLVIGGIAFLSIFSSLNEVGYMLPDAEYDLRFAWGIAFAIVMGIGHLLALINVGMRIYEWYKRNHQEAE